MIPRRERFEMVDNKAEKLSSRKQCELLCIPRIYYKPKSESQVNLYIMRLMDEQYLKTPFYGFPRMYDYVKDSCPLWILNPKRIYRLYKKMGLKSLLPGPHTSKPNPKSPYKFAYLLKNLKIERANQVWASDIRNHESIGKITPARMYGAKNNSQILTKNSINKSNLMV